MIAAGPAYSYQPRRFTHDPPPPLRLAQATPRFAQATPRLAQATPPPPPLIQLPPRLIHPPPPPLTQEPRPLTQPASTSSGSSTPPTIATPITAVDHFLNPARKFRRDSSLCS